MPAVNSWIVRIFSALWALFLLLDYLHHSGYLSGAFTHFRYSSLIFTAIVVASVTAYLFISRHKGKAEVLIKNFRPLYHYLFLLVFMTMIMGFYLSKTDLVPQISNALFVFLFRTLGFHLAVLIIVAAAYAMGSLIMYRTKIELTQPVHNLISIALGFLIVSLGLFLLGVFHLLQLIPVAILLLICLVSGYKHLLNWIQSLLKTQQPFTIHIAAIVPYVFTLFLIALNLCYLTRPFPIGFDDMNLYMNTPKLLAGYGALTQGGDAYNWSMIMSLGFVLFDNGTIAMLLSVVPGLITLFVVYQISRLLKISRSWSVTVTMLVYTFPAIIWQSRNDAKVDLAALFISLCAVLLAFAYFFSATRKNEPVKIFRLSLSRDNVMWILCGFLLGFAFGIKYTSVLILFAMVVFAGYHFAGRWAAAGLFFLIFAFIFGLELTRFAALEAGSVYLTITPLIISLGFFVVVFINNRDQLMTTFRTLIILCVSFTIPFFPWAIKNVNENRAFNFGSMLTGKSPLPELFPDQQLSIRHDANHQPQQLADISGLAGKLIQQLSEGTPLALKLNQNPVSGSTTDKYEEVRRYLGYEPGFIRFLSLPYDLLMKQNVKLWSVDPGIWLMILLPLMMLSFGGRNLFRNVIKMIVLIFILVASIISTEMQDGFFNLRSSLDNLQINAFAEMGSWKSFLLPVYVSLKSLLLKLGQVMLPAINALSLQSLGLSFMLVMLSCIPFYFLYRNDLTNLNPLQKSLAAITFTSVAGWMVISSGIFWYGMAGFALLAILTILLVTKKSETAPGSAVFSQGFASTVILSWMIIITPFQFMPIRFTMMKDMSQVDFDAFIDRPFAEYAVGRAGEKDVFRKFFTPTEQQIIQHINNDKGVLLLNVGTFLTYHIANNDQRVIPDNQLGIFNRFLTKSKNKQELIADLKSKKIKYILVSLYTPTLDETPEKSLTEKYNNMMRGLLTGEGSRLLYTNRIVERPDGNMERMVEGRRVRAAYHLAGVRMLDQGSVALFEIF
jgi:hypothetical protein